MPAKQANITEVEKLQYKLNNILEKKLTIAAIPPVTKNTRNCLEKK